MLSDIRNADLFLESELDVDKFRKMLRIKHPEESITSIQINRDGSLYILTTSKDRPGVRTRIVTQEQIKTLKLLED